jgi:hypothetical protein
MDKMEKNLKQKVYKLLLEVNTNLQRKKAGMAFIKLKD